MTFLNGNFITLPRGDTAHSLLQHVAIRNAAGAKTRTRMLPKLILHLLFFVSCALFEQAVCKQWMVGAQYSRPISGYSRDGYVKGTH